MTLTYCAECRTWHNDGRHYAVWLTRIEDTDEWIGYAATDAEAAAELAAEEYDREDYSLAKGSSVEIAVRRSDQEPAEAEIFIASGEAVMQYHVTLKGDI